MMAPGSVGEPNVNGPPTTEATVRLMEPSRLSCGDELSVTCTVRSAVPAAVGNPLIVQLFAAKLNPAGSVPAVMVQA